MCSRHACLNLYSLVDGYHPCLGRIQGLLPDVPIIEKIQDKLRPGLSPLGGGAAARPESAREGAAAGAAAQVPGGGEGAGGQAAAEVAGIQHCLAYGPLWVALCLMRVG